MPVNNRAILIATNSGDDPNYGEVARHLVSQGCTVTVYEPDSIAKGTREFTARIDNSGHISLTYNHQPFDLGSFGAAWYRRPHYYGYYKDQLRWFSLRDEYTALQNNIWDLLPESAWFNVPTAMRRADVKLPQLRAAASLGFRIPDTVISNNWEEVESFEQDTLVVKLAEQISLPTKDSEKIMPTTILKHNALPKQALSYPGIWQPYYKKKREWRITVVGEKIFSVAIYTKSSAKDDWRMHQFGPGVTFKVESFPRELEKKCILLLRHFGLRYGAFDFIETPDGKIIFLEVNPNGQFMWLEERLGIPISEAVAHELIRIASSRSIEPAV